MRTFSIFGIIISVLGLLISGYIGYAENEFRNSMGDLCREENIINQEIYSKLDSLYWDHSFFGYYLAIIMGIIFTFFLVFSIYINKKS